MTKVKIAISLDEHILQVVDSKIDNHNLRSRSHAIEYFLEKGLETKKIDKATIMLRADQHKKILDTKLFDKQLTFLKQNNISTLVFATQPSQLLEKLKRRAEDEGFIIRVYQGQTKNNSDALLLVKTEFSTDCVVISGDVLNDFDLQAMITKHIRLGKLASMGIMSKSQTSTEGSVFIDGDVIVDFKEKSTEYLTNIVNAGIYILSPECLNLLEGKQNIEYELFPKIAKLKQLVGHFIYGKYEHAR